MSDDDDDLIEGMLKDLIAPDFSDLPIPEQIAQAKSVLHRLETAVDDLRSDPAAASTKNRRRTASPELPALIGDVVMAAAWAEDAAGTLLQALSGNWEFRAKGYDDTSSSLIRALKQCLDSELVERFETALSIRHFVVHGFFIEASFIKHPITGASYDFVSMKRSWRTEAPERQIKAFTADALRWLAQEFWDIEAALERRHSEVLFGKMGDNLAH